MNKLIALIVFSSLWVNGSGQTFTRTELPTELSRPWEITVAPDDFLWLTESGGRVSRMDPVTGIKETVYTATDYFSGADSERWEYCFHPPIGTGTLGLTLHPDFAMPDSAYVYFVYSYNSGTADAPKTQFKVARLKWDPVDEVITENVDLITDIPSGHDHLGGRLLAVKRNGKSHLFLTLGDHGLSEDNSPDCYPDQSLNPNNRAQDPTTPNGKIHRFNMDGTIPADNPLPGNSFYTRGHRNPQGLMYDYINDQLFNVEHGDRTDDEINCLYKGMNYGWKLARGYHADDNYPGEAAFVVNYVPDESIENDSLVEAFYSWCTAKPSASPDNGNWCTVAPCDGVFYFADAIPQWKNSLLVVTLKDGDDSDMEVYRFKLSVKGELLPSTPEAPNPERFFGEDQTLNGRLRDIAVSNDGSKIYLINNGGASTNKVTVYTVVPEPKEQPEDCMRLYPNPVQSSAFFDGGQYVSGITAIEIFASSGEQVWKAEEVPDVLNTEGWGAGIYTVRITHDGGTCSTRFLKLNE